MVKSICEYMYFLFDWQKQLYGSDLICFSVLKTTLFDHELWLYKDCIKLLFFTQTTFCSSFLLYSKCFLCSVQWLELLHLLKEWKPGLLGVVESLKGGSLEIQNWLTIYLYETNRKSVNTPELVSFTWMKQQNLNTVRSLLKERRLKHFLELTGNIYPDLVKVFYTKLQFNGDSLVSHVKGVDMVITNDVWAVVAGLKFSGLRINRGNLGVVEEFNKM